MYMTSFYTASFPNIIGSSKNYLETVSETTEKAKQIIKLINAKNIKDNKFYNKIHDIYDDKIREIDESYTRIANSIANYDECLDIINKIITMLSNSKNTIVDPKKFDSKYDDMTMVYSHSKEFLEKLYYNYNEIKEPKNGMYQRYVRTHKKIYSRAKQHIKIAKTNLEKSKKKVDEFKETMDKLIIIVNSKRNDTKLSTLAKHATDARHNTLIAKRNANKINEDEEEEMKDIQFIKDLQFSPNSGGKTTRKKRRNNRRSRKFRGGYSMNSALVGMANFPISNSGGVNLPPQSSFI